METPAFEPELAADDEFIKMRLPEVTGACTDVASSLPDAGKSESEMAVRGVRGATTVSEDKPELIREAARELMEEILRRNQISDFDDVISAVFTTTGDLVSAFPAEAARHMGMNSVPLLCAQEIPVPGSMPRCLRILLHVNSERSPREIEHVYLRDAQRLRPDLRSAQ